MPKRRPLLRAIAELLNAANGLQPLAREGYPTIPVFAFGWPTSELSPLYMAGSMLDAVRRGIRGDFGGPRGRIAVRSVKERPPQHAGVDPPRVERPSARRARQPHFGGAEQHRVDLIEVAVVALEDVVERRAVVGRCR